MCAKARGMSAIEFIVADLEQPEHQQIVAALINAYSTDPMGDGHPLSAEAAQRLIPGLRKHPTTLILLAFEGKKPVGIAVCFRGFSTFAARPLMNIHDLHVLPSHQGRGIGRGLIEAVAAKARELDCCKLTLEVQNQNHRARKTYAASGFRQQHDESPGGGVIFMTRPL